MAREQYTERQPEPQAVAPAAAPPAESSSTGTFVTQGPIPPVETSGGPSPATASERAFGSQPAEPEPSGLRGIISRRELVVGNPADPASGYIVVSQKQGGAKWKTADGSFTGTADKNGLDTQYRLGEHDALHGHVGTDKTGTLAWERDGKNQGELYGRYGSAHDYEAGVRRQFDVGGGTLTAGARHRVDAAGATDGVFGTYKNGATTADGNLGVRDGHFVGTGSVATTLGRDQLSASVAHDERGTTLDARDQHDFGGGYSGTAQIHHGPEGTTGTLAGAYRNGATTADANVGVRDGHFVGAGSIATTLGRDQLSASVAHDGRGTTLDARDQHDFGGGYSGTAQIHHGPEGTTGMLAGAYKDANTQIDGNITRGLDRTSLHLGGTQQVSPQLSVSGALDHVRPDHGASQSTLSLSERYRSGDMIHGANLEVGHGARDYLKATGSLDARLAPNLYGGVWGGSEVERGHQASAQLGANLTFSTNEKSALTLAGVLDQDGRLETRLQFDLFKSKIESIGDLDREKKNALVSVFLSYSQAGNRHTLDQRFGEPNVQTNVGNQVTAGIKIKF